MKTPENATPAGYCTLKLCGPKLNTLSAVGLSCKVIDWLLCALASVSPAEISATGTNMEAMKTETRWERWPEIFTNPPFAVSIPLGTLLFCAPHKEEVRTKRTTLGRLRDIACPRIGFLTFALRVCEFNIPKILSVRAYRVLR